MTTILSRLTITADGQRYSTEERGTTIDIGGEDNEPIVDSDGKTHTLSSMKPGVFKVSMLALEGLKLRQVQQLKNAVIVAEGNTGQDYIMHNARCGTAREITGGKISAVFYGDVEEM